MRVARGTMDTAIATGELSWQSVYWSLFSLALNTMVQPSGSVCGFRPSLSIYLKSSPVVCIFDTVALLTRFIIYAFRSRSLSNAARLIRKAGRYGPENTLEEYKGFECPLIFRFGVFVVGIIYSFSKLLVSSGIPWSKTRACCYFVSFLT